MATQDDSEPRAQETGRVAAAAAAVAKAHPQRVRDTHAANAWARQGRMAIQASHTLTVPLARFGPARVEREAEPGAGKDGHAPTFAIPEQVLHSRPPQRLPEDAVCRSPIAGLVIAVLAAPGEQVKKQQPVLVIEAMKMQNHVGPVVDGVVKAIHVSPGAAVKAGQVLFELA